MIMSGCCREADRCRRRYGTDGIGLLQGLWWRPLRVCLGEASVPQLDLFCTPTSAAKPNPVAVHTPPGRNPDLSPKRYTSAGRA